ncbi:GDNF-inducible zinc finger protein 1 [Desmophyllum pertusum]|uniref:GDNF-inducible zinc finger protein 1 n=1 Tax=Desmophyllum pertusum TaxID=174260 RepID=A0A9W9ZZX0_9CNID|nr:GDNF-inducible zinc finger protein 1 [Desmophyllum pertusum]
MFFTVFRPGLDSWFEAGYACSIKLRLPVISWVHVLCKPTYLLKLILVTKIHSRCLRRKHELLKHVLLIHYDDKDASELVCDDSTVTSESDGSNSGKRQQEELGGMQDVLQQDEVRSAPTVLKRPRRRTKCCWICQKTFHSVTALKRHIQSHTGEKTFPCDHCDKYFANKREQQNHLRFLNLERLFKCEQCGKAFKKQCLLNIHLIRHGSERPFQCPHCPKSYKFNLKLKEHVRIHTGEKPYECQYCDKAFALLQQRVQHELVEHDVGKKLTCSHCSETFYNSSSLWRHSLSHKSNFLRCDKCPYVTLFKVRMAKHKITHTNEKPYSCGQCSSRFTQLGRLKIHMRSHTGEKPYACDQCEKAFVDSYSLKRHARTHTGEKPYKCNYCNMSFAQGCQRQFHERTHTGEKPYACSQCEKKFIRRQELNKHLETHKKGKQPAKKKRKLASKES